MHLTFRSAQCYFSLFALLLTCNEAQIYGGKCIDTDIWKNLFSLIRKNNFSSPLSYTRSVGRGEKETRTISSIGKFGYVSLLATDANASAKTTIGCWRKLKASRAKDFSPGVALIQDCVRVRSVLQQYPCQRSFVSLVLKGKREIWREEVSIFILEAVEKLRYCFLYTV